MEWVWIDGGVAQDQSAGVAVIDTDVSDVPDASDIDSAADTLKLALDVGAPAYVVEAAREALRHVQAAVVR